MMKRLLLVLGLGSFLSVAVAQSTRFNYEYPVFFGIATNVYEVDFFVTPNNTPQGAITTDSALDYHNLLDNASSANLENCIQSAIASTNVQVGSNSTTDFQLNCLFAPTKVVRYGFSVTGYKNLQPAGATDNNGNDDHPTDGEILVITNNTQNGSTSFVVKASTTGTPPSFGNIQVASGYVTDTSSLQPVGSSSIVWQELDQTSDTVIFNQNNSLTTNYKYFYAIPLVFRIQITNLADNTSGLLMTVTWDAAAPQ